MREGRATTSPSPCIVPARHTIFPAPGWGISAGHFGEAVSKSRWFRTLQRWRYPLSAVFDAAVWYPVLYLAALARFGFDPTQLDFAGLVIVASVGAAVNTVVGIASGLYRGKRPIASFYEVRLVLLSTSTATTSAFLTVVMVGPPNLVPLSAVLAAGAYQLLLALGMRYALRWALELSSRSRHLRDHRLLVFGAGEAGGQIIKALNQDPSTDLDPVALLDDDPTKRRLILHTIRVVGTRQDIEDAAAAFSADTLLLAMPSATQQQINEIADLGLAADLALKVLPSAHSLARSTVSVRDIRDIEMSDFLNREEVRIDDESVRAYIEGRRVLVTGAGGSIGSVLCRTLVQYQPSQLIMLDHDENALHALTLPDRSGEPNLDPSELVLCDIRDRETVLAVFEATHPQVVFHAAAHKHVGFLEQFPSEGFKTNVSGTMNVLTAAAATACDRFVNISTDKAAEPVNVLGTTKRIAEQATSQFDATSEGAYISVRFGNVLGSKGSVIPTFVEQLRCGEALTVTDARATRYFMTTEEAILLVLQAGALGRGGDVLVLDMGEPVKIDDLARRLSRQLTPSRPPEIVYTGLRPGEKLHEDVASSSDTLLGKPHDRLTRYSVPPLSQDGVVVDVSDAVQQLPESPEGQQTSRKNRAGL